MTTKFGDFWPLQPLDGPFVERGREAPAARAARGKAAEAGGAAAGAVATGAAGKGATAPPLTPYAPSGAPMRLRGCGHAGKNADATFGPLLPLFAGEPYSAAAVAGGVARALPTRHQKGGGGSGSSGAARATAGAAFRPPGAAMRAPGPAPSLSLSAVGALPPLQRGPGAARAAAAAADRSPPTAAAAAAASTAAASASSPVLPPQGGHRNHHQQQHPQGRRNFVTRPPRKGSYGTPGTTLGPRLEYLADPCPPAPRCARAKPLQPFLVPARPSPGGDGTDGGDTDGGGGGAAAAVTPSAGLLAGPAASRRNEGLGGRVGGACGEFAWQACPPAPPGALAATAAASAAATAATAAAGSSPSRVLAPPPPALRPFRPAPSRSKLGGTFSPYLSLSVSAVLTAPGGGGEKGRPFPAAADADQGAGEEGDEAGGAPAAAAARALEGGKKGGGGGGGKKGGGGGAPDNRAWRGGACGGRLGATRSIVQLCAGRRA